jgi:uroporphyrinogen-III synthase
VRVVLSREHFSRRNGNDNGKVDVISEEPSTWHELLQAIDGAFGNSLGEMHVVVQEYGASNPELLAELSGRSYELTKLPVYQWALPEDLQPLQECVQGIINGTLDVVLFMTAVQIIHLFRVAEHRFEAMLCTPILGAGQVVGVTIYSIAFLPSHQ